MAQLDATPAIDPGASARVRVALLPVGATSPARFHEHAALLAAQRAVPLAALDRDMLPGASSQAFPCQAGEWESGELRFEWVDGAELEADPWEAFQAHRGVLAVPSPSSSSRCPPHVPLPHQRAARRQVVGVCHCPENAGALMPAFEAFLARVQGSLPCACALAVHCFALDPLPEHAALAGGPVGHTLHLVPRARAAGDGGGVGAALGALGAELLRGLEQNILQVGGSGARLNRGSTAQKA